MHGPPGRSPLWAKERAAEAVGVPGFAVFWEVFDFWSVGVSV